MGSAPKILLFGKNGQVGSVLRHDLSRVGKVVGHDRASCDICDEVRVREVIRTLKPNIIVNAAAYTAVDRAETELQNCFRTNAIAPRLIAEEARKLGAYMIHYSTDYVFDGAKHSAYLESDVACPLNNYGRSKLTGDQAIMDLGGQSTILRVGWVYSSGGSNFAKTILKLAADREELKIVGDQFGAPTSARLISSVTTQIVSRFLANRDRQTTSPLFGLFNLAPSGRTSWHSYAMYLIKEARRMDMELRIQESRINAITSEEYSSAARRPKNSLLDTNKLRKMLSIELPDWREDVSLLLGEMKNGHKEPAMRNGAP